jgi:polysaccharide pyruvyl transferase WcaK-like protein
MHHASRNVDHPVQVRVLGKILRSFPEDQVTIAIHEEYDRNLVDLLHIPSRMVFESSRPQDYFDLYTNPDHVVLAMRLHAGMLAVANGVPAVFVGHDARTWSFCDMMGLESIRLFSKTCADECIGRLQRSLDGKVSEFSGMQSRYSALMVGMRRFLGLNALPAWQPSGL